MVLAFASLLAGCGSSSGDADTTSETDSETTTSSSNVAEEADEDIIGEVSYVGSSYISVRVYNLDGDVEDYASLDIGTLTASDATDSVNTDSNTTYYKVENGSLVSAVREDVEKGDMIAATISEDQLRQIIILSDETGETTKVEVGEVTAIGDTGVLSLKVYTRKELAGNYEITDFTDVTPEQYEASEETKEYEIPSDAVFQMIADDSVTEIESSEIVVGDILVIQTDAESGSSTITVHHTDNGE